MNVLVIASLPSNPLGSPDFEDIYEVVALQVDHSSSSRHDLHNPSGVYQGSAESGRDDQRAAVQTEKSLTITHSKSEKLR